MAMAKSQEKTAFSFCPISSHPQSDGACQMSHCALWVELDGEAGFMGDVEGGGSCAFQAIAHGINYLAGTLHRMVP